MLPADYKIYEKEGNTYRLIFAREEDASFDPQGRLSDLSHDDLLEKMDQYCRALKNPPSFEKDDDLFVWKNEMTQKMNNAWFIAQKKGVSEEAMKSIFQRHDLGQRDSL